MSELEQRITALEDEVRRLRGLLEDGTIFEVLRSKRLEVVNNEGVAVVELGSAESEGFGLLTINDSHRRALIETSMSWYGDGEFRINVNGGECVGVALGGQHSAESGRSTGSVVITDGRQESIPLWQEPRPIDDFDPASLGEPSSPSGD